VRGAGLILCSPILVLNDTDDSAKRRSIPRSPRQVSLAAFPAALLHLSVRAERLCNYVSPIFPFPPLPSCWDRQSGESDCSPTASGRAGNKTRPSPWRGARGRDYQAVPAGREREREREQGRERERRGVWNALPHGGSQQYTQTHSLMMPSVPCYS